jgi:hypothetical protein
MCSICYLWEDVRRAEKLDTVRSMRARGVEIFSMAPSRGMKLRSRSVPSAEAGLIARCTLPHTHRKSVSNKWV